MREREIDDLAGRVAALDPEEVEAEMDAAMRRLFVGKILAEPRDDPNVLRPVDPYDTIDRIPARTGASQTMTSGTVSIRCTQRSKTWKGPQNLAPVTGPNRQARRAAAAKERRA